MGHSKDDRREQRHEGYEPPVIERLGTLEELTLGAGGRIADTPIPGARISGINPQ